MNIRYLIPILVLIIYCTPSQSQNPTENGNPLPTSIKIQDVDSNIDANESNDDLNAESDYLWEDGKGISTGSTIDGQDNTEEPETDSLTPAIEDDPFSSEVDESSHKSIEEVKNPTTENHKESKLHVNNLTIYPNPTVDKAVISFSRITDLSPIKIEILDITGDLMETIQIAGEDLSIIQRIDLSDLASGTYYLKIIRGNQSLTEKIVKL